MNKTFTRIFLAGAIGLASAPGAFALDHLLIIGDATPGGWSINDGLMMVQDTQDANVYHYMGWLEGDKNFKFTGDTDFKGSELEFRNASSDPKDISKMVTANNDENDYQFQVSESANYDITVNVADLTVSAKKADYQANHVRFDVLYIIGNATEAGWDLSAAIPAYAEKSNPMILTLTTDLKEGEYKFLGNPWANWGGPWFHPYYTATNGTLDESSINYSRLTEDNSCDVKWTIASGKEGKYDIKLNLQDMSFACTPAVETGIDNVNAATASVSARYDLSGARINGTPRAGTLCIEVLSDGTARKVRF